MPQSNRKTSLQDDRTDNNPGPMPWEKGLTLEEGVLWMVADGVGLGGRGLVYAGLKDPKGAQPVLRLLRAAAQASSAALGKRLAQRTTAELEQLDEDITRRHRARSSGGIRP